ncbi:Lysophospholipid acyltransferase 5 [Strongyloides ratti]|uniref:Lysophospholipid acyltransferase 5 n=1 Tax=Strongyloides ratti TaxID=34506 RepID=A0A090KQS0_STRRB|nr:Lysophospholipid acyltransferase 5 [Strongyloides ratti]CEF59888.1 Lysophospholipid acyltransferase 5 [Strongyloides ratti]
MGAISMLAEAINFNEDGLRLLLSIMAGYPFGAIYRTLFYNKSAQIQYIYFIVTGIMIYLFNCGTNKYFVAMVHTFFLGYLLIGYWFTESDEYDINWTTPYCIMVLRLIGLCLDAYDGTIDEKKLSGDAIKNNIKVSPGLVEIAAYSFYLPFTLVGPVIPLNYFREYVDGKHLTKSGNVRSSSLMVSVRRFLAGVTFAVFNQWGTFWITNEYFNSQDFFNLPFLWKVIWTTIWYRSTFYKYACAWLLVEGSSILSGIGYTGKGNKDNDKWDGCRNISLRGFFLGSDYQSCVESFNINTNTWAKNHVFKRLRFLGNKYLSQGTTLLYLAIWHGYHSGYFILFGYEMICMISQAQLYEIIPRIPGLRQLLDKPYIKPLTWLFGKILITTTMGFAFLTFGLIKKEFWIRPILSQYAWGYILYIVIWPVIYYTLCKLFPKKKLDKKSSESKKEL